MSFVTPKGIVKLRRQLLPTLIKSFSIFISRNEFRRWYERNEFKYNNIDIRRVEAITLTSRTRVACRVYLPRPWSMTLLILCIIHRVVRLLLLRSSITFNSLRIPTLWYRIFDCANRKNKKKKDTLIFEPPNLNPCRCYHHHHPCLYFNKDSKMVNNSSASSDIRQFCAPRSNLSSIRDVFEWFH